MSEQNLVEIPENGQNENIEVPETQAGAQRCGMRKKELSQKQIEHLNNIRVKALEKKREIKLKKNEEYKNKVSKPEVIEEPIKQPIEIKPDIKSDVKIDIKSDVKKKKVIKKVIRYVETDSDDDADDEVITKTGAQRCEMKKPEPIQQPKPIEKSYNELLCESSLERMQNKIMNERAKHLITNIIPNYY